MATTIFQVLAYMIQTENATEFELSAFHGTVFLLEKNASKT